MHQLKGIAILYALSFYQVSKEISENITNHDSAQDLKNLEMVLFNQVCFIEDIFKENIEFIKILILPSIGKKEKQNLIDTIFKDKINGYIINFFKIIIDNNRCNLIFEIINEYKKIYYKNNNIKEIEIISALELTNLDKKYIENKCKRIFKKKIIASYKIDDHLIGGIVLKIEDHIYDMTIKNKLANIKKSIKSQIIF